MNPVTFAVMAVFLYAVQNVLTEMELKEQGTFSLMVCFYSLILPLSILGMWLKDGNHNIFAIGDWRVILIAFAVGFSLFLADFSYLSAYTIGRGDVMTITTIAITLPVFATAIKCFLGGSLPNYYQLAGYILAAGSVVLLAKGAE